MGEPGLGNTETFISIGKFATAFESQSLSKYIATKFVRSLLGALKTTQDVTPEKWAYVPQQDFSQNSDIDWSLSVGEIDSLLFEKYQLTKAEVAFVEERVQRMNLNK